MPTPRNSPNRKEHKIHARKNMPKKHATSDHTQKITFSGSFKKTGMGICVCSILNQHG